MDGYTTDETYSDDSESDYQSINEEDFNTKSKTSSKWNCDSSNLGQ